MSIEQIIAAINRVVARKAKTKLPRRYDTRPIRFEVFRERTCVECGNTVLGAKYCSSECRKLHQAMKAAVSEKKLASRSRIKPGGTKLHRHDNADGMRREFEKLPAGWMDILRVMSAWSMGKTGARRRLLKLVDMGWLEVRPKEPRGFEWRRI